MAEMGHNSRFTYPDPDGFVAIARSMRFHPIVGCGHPGTPCDPSRPAWSRYEAFQDLVMECRYKSGTVNNGGRVMVIQPGQLVGAVSWLAQRWNWTPKAVRYFLDLLEAEAMIDRGYGDDRRESVQTGNTDGAENWGKYESAGREESGKSGANHKGKQAHIITLCKYAIYQFLEDYKGQIQTEPEGQIRGKSDQNLGQHNKEGTKKGIQEDKSPPPTPRKRGARKELTESDIALTDLAVSLYNAEAVRLNLSRCIKIDADRRSRLLKRLEEIGGIEPFKVALTAIERVPFLLGKVPAKPGQDPFKLDLERLLSTGSNLGNVLCKLIDKASDGATGPRTIEQVAAEIASMDDQQQADLVGRHANGRWPADKLAYSPADRRCAIRPQVYRTFGITERTYDIRGMSTGVDPVSLPHNSEGNL